MTERMTITNPFGPHHYQFRLQPNPIFPLQIQFPSIAPYITGCSRLLPHFLWGKKLKDYCHRIIGKLHFQFPTHVLCSWEGRGRGERPEKAQSKGKKCKWKRYYQLYITPAMLRRFPSQVTFLGKRRSRVQVCCHSSTFFYHRTKHQFTLYLLRYLHTAN